MSSLPSTAIDRILHRLGATYGRQWILMWEGVDPNAVKAIWGHELSVFSQSPERLAWALENLPTKCPNVIEFKALCRAAPIAEAKPLPAPKADPERLRRELAKLGDMRKELPRNPGHMKDWARAILADHKAGRRVLPIALKFAQEALRTHLPASE